jgi:RNA polymerase sigma-70 factor (ECF subfamily)
VRNGEEVPDCPEDAVLAARARSMDKEAFGALVGRYERPLEGILLSFTKDRSQARDLVQEAVLRAWQHLDAYREEHRFSTWFFRIGVNLAITARRRAAYETRFREAARTGGEEQVAESPLELLLRDEDKGRLAAALADLPDRYREIVRMRYADEMSCKDIAKKLGTTPNTVSIVLFRAKQRLRELLGIDEPPGDVPPGA